MHKKRRHANKLYKKHALFQAQLLDNNLLDLVNWKSEVISVVGFKMTVFWYVTSCNFGDVLQRFG